jgi:hypothetical protein
MAVGWWHDVSEQIYVQIPAYRDRELLPTVRDLMRTAREPARLRVAIAWQYGSEETHLEDALRQWRNVELQKIPAAESEGCNWARRRLQQGWNGEAYTLLLDSHHRFAPAWDETSIQLLNDRKHAGSAKPILTAYLPPYDPQDDPRGRSTNMLKIHPLQRHEGLLFRLTGHAVEGWKSLKSPIPAHFTSLHFLFADGSFNEAIPFDSSIYFFADEVATALRAYTHGYDLFHPHCALGWHLYDRATRVPHWADHASWRAQNQNSVERLRALYRGAVQDKYGVGRVRSIADYEAYIGVPLATPVWS